MLHIGEQTLEAFSHDAEVGVKWKVQRSSVIGLLGDWGVSSFRGFANHLKRDSQGAFFGRLCDEALWIARRPVCAD
jgi:hypothetical protein